MTWKTLDNRKSLIHKINSQQQFILLMNDYPLLRILTNGNNVYAWEYEIACHDDVRRLFPDITDDWVAYRIDKGRLLHSTKIDYQTMQTFLRNWFPDCYYCEHIDEYDKLNGLNLFAKRK